MSGRIKTILSLVVGAVFVYWFVHELNWREVWSEVHKANFGQLGLALALLVVSIDLALGWSFERWIAPSSSMSPLLLAAIMFLPALICAFCCCKLFLHLKDRMR